MLQLPEEKLQGCFESPGPISESQVLLGAGRKHGPSVRWTGGTRPVGSRRKLQPLVSTWECWLLAQLARSPDFQDDPELQVVFLFSFFLFCFNEYAVSSGFGDFFVCFFNLPFMSQPKWRAASEVSLLVGSLFPSPATLREDKEECVCVLWVNSCLPAGTGMTSSAPQEEIPKIPRLFGDVYFHLR